jgi:PAS domain S-box-containing protein
MEPTGTGSAGAGVPTAAEASDVLDLGRGELDFAAFLELVPDAIVLVERYGEILHTNALADELFGYEPGALVGKPVETLIPTHLMGNHVSHRERFFSEPRRRPMGIGLELHGRRRGGAEFPAEISLAPIETPNGTMVAAAVRDLTERVEGERRRHEAARRMESLGELAGGVAHDFNNLLTVIGENARFALEGSTDPVARESLAEIQRASERGAELAAQLLVFGRPGPAGVAPVDLNAAIADVERLLSRTLGGGIVLGVRPAPGLPPVGATRGQVDQILLNLAINARDAMPEGGRLEIATEAAEDHARLTVTDEGTGMPPEVAERAFEPFFSTKPEGRGSGLGLATVNGIVRRIGGRVSLRTEPGRGTIVIVRLPYARGSAPQPA